MTRGSRPVVFAAFGVVAWWALSCREVSTPAGGVFSTSPLILPSPGVVAGDTMRDSLGLVAPLQVYAFNLAGDTIQNATPSFVVIDTGKLGGGAHLVGALLVGDTVAKTVHVVATVGDVQTLPEAVKVTLSPDTIVAADSILHHKTFSLANGDTVATSGDLSTFVRHVDASLTGVEAVVVRYTIERAPPALPSKGPTVVLVNTSNAPSTRDTSDVSGKASLRARLRVLALESLDTVFVSATASYRGRSLGIVQFTIVFTNQ